VWEHWTLLDVYESNVVLDMYAELAAVEAERMRELNRK